MYLKSRFLARENMKILHLSIECSVFLDTSLKQLHACQKVMIVDIEAIIEPFLDIL